MDIPMAASGKPRVVICVGDVHGYMVKLQNLWHNLEKAIDPSDFSTALVIFWGLLRPRAGHEEGDRFLDFIADEVPKSIACLLCGNHDLAFAAFLGIVKSPSDGSDFSEGWKEFEMNEAREGWYKGEGYKDMYLQGRRWAGRMSGINHAKGTVYQGSIYDAAPTFQSYGVQHGSADLRKAVPEEHKKFLADLVWVHEEDDVSIETEGGLQSCKLIAVHAGLEKSKPVEEQLSSLKAKDTKIPKIEALSGRKNVWDIPEGLTQTSTIIVSGHHGKVHIDGLRLIIDLGGGLVNNPVAAAVLPSKKLVLDTDVVA